MADSLRHGDNPSSIPGRGIEVSGVREYQHGDEARGIDWRVTARRGRLFVKEFSQERELPLLVILNLTPTLWSGRGESKADPGHGGGLSSGRPGPPIRGPGRAWSWREAGGIDDSPGERQESTAPDPHRP